MHRGAWWATVHGGHKRIGHDLVTKQQPFSCIDRIFENICEAMEKEMATHSGILAWRIPWREEPGRLQSIGSQRVGHN